MTLTRFLKLFVILAACGLFSAVQPSHALAVETWIAPNNLTFTFGDWSGTPDGESYHTWPVPVDIGDTITARLLVYSEAFIDVNLSATLLVARQTQDGDVNAILNTYNLDGLTLPDNRFWELDISPLFLNDDGSSILTQVIPGVDILSVHIEIAPVVLTTNAVELAQVPTVHIGGLGLYSPLQVVPGTPGPQGPPGPQGQQGKQGPAGPKGNKGDKGEDGTAAEKGDKGDTGPQGKQGPAGNAANCTLDIHPRVDSIVIQGQQSGFVTVSCPQGYSSTGGACAADPKDPHVTVHSNFTPSDDFNCEAVNPNALPVTLNAYVKCAQLICN